MSFYMIAGEASGDLLGADLMAGLLHFDPKVQFLGLGGRLMQAQGMQSLFDISELSVMGITEIVPKYFVLKRRIAQVAADVASRKPDVLITIDSPDFCLRVAKQLRAWGFDIPIIHYVAPSVWAWRPNRAVKMARVVDHVLALLPFEPPLMQAAGLSCDFVGHPIAARAAPKACTLSAGSITSSGVMIQSLTKARSGSSKCGKVGTTTRAFG